MYLASVDMQLLFTTTSMNSAIWDGPNFTQGKTASRSRLLSLVIYWAWWLKQVRQKKQPGNSIFDISYISVLLIFVLMYNDHDTDCDIDNDINHK